MKFYWFTHNGFGAYRTSLLRRTGYTAEDGFEIYVPTDEATSARVWYEVMEAGKEFGIVPCGLGARNTLRLEGRLPLYGHEISDSINVWEAGLERFLKMEKGDFTGRAALERARADGIKLTLVGLESVDRGIPRELAGQVGGALGVALPARGHWRWSSPPGVTGIFRWDGYGSWAP